jgi:Pyridine nucleotide-disulphide oxidoreductase
MTASTEVAIIGAGPYGLSLAAHLRAAAVPYRIFGRPMDSWRNHMPAGMLLKSDGFASSLSDPQSSFTLEHFCAREGIEYHATDVPVRLESFTAYGLAFQKRFAPDLQTKLLTKLDRLPDGFRMRFDDDEELQARCVAVAVGISYFPYIPPALTHCPSSLLTHSFAHSDLAGFRGARVAVIGAGASALDLAALLHEQGANVHLIARTEELIFHNRRPPGERTLWKRVRQPSTGIGPGLKSLVYTEYPNLFRRLPGKIRVKIVKTHLGPAGGWPMRDRVVGRVALTLGFEVSRAEPSGQQVCLQLAGRDGTVLDHVADHVIVATGYRADLRRLPFVQEEVLSQIRCLEHAPVLSANFECSIPGLYFLGLASANSFGPMMRFAYGADYTAKKIVNHIVSRT